MEGPGETTVTDTKVVWKDGKVGTSVVERGVAVDINHC